MGMFDDFTVERQIGERPTKEPDIPSTLTYFQLAQENAIQKTQKALEWWSKEGTRGKIENVPNILKPNIVMKKITENPGTPRQEQREEERTVSWQIKPKIGNKAIGGYSGRTVREDEVEAGLKQVLECIEKATPTDEGGVTLVDTYKTTKIIRYKSWVGTKFLPKREEEKEKGQGKVYAKRLKDWMLKENKLEQKPDLTINLTAFNNWWSDGAPNSQGNVITTNTGL